MASFIYLVLSEDRWKAGFGHACLPPQQAQGLSHVVSIVRYWNFFMVAQGSNGSKMQEVELPISYSPQLLLYPMGHSNHPALPDSQGGDIDPSLHEHGANHSSSFLTCYKHN